MYVTSAKMTPYTFSVWKCMQVQNQCNISAHDESRGVYYMSQEVFNIVCDAEASVLSVPPPNSQSSHYKRLL
jgi:hypothetical protein